jgi:hypothetical protein
VTGRVDYPTEPPPVLLGYRGDLNGTGSNCSIDDVVRVLDHEQRSACSPAHGVRAETLHLRGARRHPERSSTDL